MPNLCEIGQIVRIISPALDQCRRGVAFVTIYPANMRRLPNVRLMLGQRRRRFANINPTLGQRLLFAEYP